MMTRRSKFMVYCETCSGYLDIEGFKRLDYFLIKTLDSLHKQNYPQHTTRIDRW